MRRWFHNQVRRASTQALRQPSTSGVTSPLGLTNSARTSATPELRSSGKPIEGNTRAFMESRFGHDFSDVRVHSDERAASQAKALDAQAYTVNSNIVFGAGRYRPESPQGRGLLTHELAHVVQQRSGPANPEAISRSGDADEVSAHRAVSDIAANRKPQLTAARAGLHRQAAGDTPPQLFPADLKVQQSQAELVVESFLNRMWEAQSKQEQPFRITAGVLEGINILFPLGAPVRLLEILDSTRHVMDRLRSRLPATVEPNAAAVLDSLPKNEKSLTTQAKSKDLEPAAVPAAPDERKAPSPPGDASEAMKKALTAGFEEFRKTRLGQELEKRGKAYVFSKEGIPLVILVVAGVLTFVAANDPKLPSVPDIPIGEGIKLKIDYSGRASDLPRLLSDLIHDRSDAAGTPERKVGVSVTVTNDALVELAKSVGHFFAEAATWIGKGVVKVGTAIGKAVGSVLPEIALTLAGAGIGAGVGAAIGGGLGAAIGALAGAATGLTVALIRREVQQT